jgi:hypothetical protein
MSRKRTGVYTMHVVGSGLLDRNVEYWPAVELAEWERLGSLSRVSVLDVSGAPRRKHAEIRDLVGKWVPTRAVVWRVAEPTERVTVTVPAPGVTPAAPAPVVSGSPYCSSWCKDPLCDGVTAAAALLLRTPDGVPDGWFVTVDEDGVPNLIRASQPQAERATKEGPDVS